MREMNRQWALFQQRNSRRTGKITVNVLAHSLGAALAIDVLSLQPTRKSPHFGLAFNVSKLYLIGSPAGLFFYLNQKTLVARESKSSEEEEDKAPERWGSLAVDQIWNVIYVTDPIGSRLNPVVHR